MKCQLYPKPARFLNRSHLNRWDLLLTSSSPVPILRNDGYERELVAHCLVTITLKLHRLIFACFFVWISERRSFRPSRRRRLCLEGTWRSAGRAASCRVRNPLGSASLEGDFDLAFFAALTCASSTSNDLIFRRAASVSSAPRSIAGRSEMCAFFGGERTWAASRDARLHLQNVLCNLADTPDLARDGPAATVVWAENEGGFNRHLRDCAWRAILVKRHHCSGIDSPSFIPHRGWLSHETLLPWRTIRPGEYVPVFST